MKRGSLHSHPFLQLHIREDQLVPLIGVNFQSVHLSVCQILRLKCVKCIKSDFGWCSVPDPAMGAYGDPPDLVVVLLQRRGREKGRG